MELRDFFAAHPRCALAFSGGVDSSYLLYEGLNYAERLGIYYVKSAFQPAFELADALRLAEALGAAVTAEVLGNEVVRLYDVGVSGIHRLLGNLETIMSARVIVAVAGMEGALPSVIGGLADCPVIAVPTSVGYGASLGGIAALLSMLNSCASGVSVVNIDNGFGAGYMASMINHLD